MVKRKTHEEFMIEIKKIHKNKSFDFTKVKYINNKEKICIFCKIHKKDFYKRADTFLNPKSNCPDCVYDAKSKNQLKTTEEYI
jgi:hypothetical protein